MLPRRSPCCAGSAPRPRGTPRRASSRSTSRTSTSGWRRPCTPSRHPGRLLHQPPALGVAAAADADVAAAGRRDARHLPVRARDLPAGRDTRDRFVGHPLVELAQPGMPRDEFLAASGFRRPRPSSACFPAAGRTRCGSILGRLLAAAPLISARLPARSTSLARAPNLPTGCSPPSLAPCARSPSSRGARTTCCTRADAVDHRLGHGDGAGGASRVPDGHRLPPVAAHLRARPAVRARGHVRHGEPRGRRARRSGVDPGRCSRPKRSPGKRFACSPTRATAGGRSRRSAA